MIHEHKNDGHTKIPIARLEAFSDGVIAIIITITVLNIKVPIGITKDAILPLIPFFITYAVSFQTVGTYWNNHHYLIRATNHVSAGIMWANLNLLFWLSLIPFATGWLGENHGGILPTAFYAAVLLLSAIAYALLQYVVLLHAENSKELKEEIRRSWKGVLSLLCYFLAMVCAFLNPIISDLLIFAVAIMWFIPDQRIQRHL